MVFFLIVILARATSVTTDGPWFSPAVSAQVYGVTFITGSLLAFGLAGLAFLRVGHIDARLRSVDRELHALSRAIKEELGGDESADPPTEHAVRDVVRVETVGGGASGVEKAGHDSILDVPRVFQATGTASKEQVRMDVRKERDHLRLARDRVWPGVAGPISLATFFVAVSAASLPGVEGPLSVELFQLNTMLILTISYTWWLLVAWSVAALALLPTDSVETKRFRPRLWERVD
ncbi:MAG: hypothetical protein ACT4OI_06065 [Methanobacteriota archaeon]